MSVDVVAVSSEADLLASEPESSDVSDYDQVGQCIAEADGVEVDNEADAAEDGTVEERITTDVHIGARHVIGQAADETTSVQRPVPEPDPVTVVVPPPRLPQTGPAPGGQPPRRRAISVPRQVPSQAEYQRPSRPTAPTPPSAAQTVSVARPAGPPTARPRPSGPEVAQPPSAPVGQQSTGPIPYVVRPPIPPVAHPPTGPIPPAAARPMHPVAHPPTSPIAPAVQPPSGPVRYPAAGPNVQSPYPSAPHSAPSAPWPQHQAFAPIPTPFTAQMPGYGPAMPGPPIPPSNREFGLVRPVRPIPQRGWRKLLYRISRINLGQSAKENTQRGLVERINQPVRGDYSIAVLSLKGGVGKTTMTLGLGSTLAAIRGDRVIAVDANPDFGTLAQRGPNQSRSTVRDLLNDDRIFRYSDIRQHTSQNASRLEILASERDPATSEAFSESDYRNAIRMLQRFYNIILTDCGTGLVHSAMAGVLDEADTVVLVVSPAVDSARSGLATLDWLTHHGYAHLVPRAVVIISAARPGRMPVDIDALAAQFLTRVRAVHVMPFDDHLAQGSEVHLDQLGWSARQALLELAAGVADGFAHASDRTHRP